MIRNTTRYIRFPKINLVLNIRYYTDGKIKVRPGPIPLGDKEAQKDIDNMIKEAYKKQMETEIEVKEEEDSEINLETGEINGPKGKEPTRYGDWERKGRVFDF